ncbi:cytochrome b5-like [Cornus florida]|uniref:cytochrome b5-like n=1 Tax=Cornus florida TaxID=4283 RepID=UPI002898C1D8|nr:cytochrome b5-like [Cornus florida]
MGVDRKVFNSDEVSVHNNAKDCWVIINAKAYDVTNFLADHPGGDEVLLAAAGKDASEEFEDVGHGSAARLMLDEFYVGEIDPSSSPEKTSYTPRTQSRAINDCNKPSELIIKLFRFLVPLTILGLAVGIRFYN